MHAGLLDELRLWMHPFFVGRAATDDLLFRAWPPRLPEQPIFYPVLNEDYAAEIAREWNVKHSGAGYVTRFQVRTVFLDRCPVQQAVDRTILEYWIPADDLPELNANLVGLIEVIAEYH
jgi:hypothetical protein